MISELVTDVWCVHNGKLASCIGNYCTTKLFADTHKVKLHLRSVWNISYWANRTAGLFACAVQFTLVYSLPPHTYRFFHIWEVVPTLHMSREISWLIMIDPSKQNLSHKNKLIDLKGLFMKMCWYTFLICWYHICSDSSERSALNIHVYDIAQSTAISQKEEAQYDPFGNELYSCDR